MVTKRTRGHELLVFCARLHIYPNILHAKIRTERGGWHMMHIGFMVIILIITWWKADWRNWGMYHPTLLYVASSDLLYNYLCTKHLLWAYKPDVILTHNSVDLVYTFIILPAISLLFLTNYPNGFRNSRHIRYITVWVLASLAVEKIIIMAGYLQFNNGWKFWMEIPFYYTMYSLIRLHQTRPLLTYALSILIIIFLINTFDVPFTTPIEKR